MKTRGIVINLVAAMLSTVITGVAVGAAMQLRLEGFIGAPLVGYVAFRFYERACWWAHQ
jgi:hypothetical protein